jgi:hypothetical protein
MRVLGLDPGINGGAGIIDAADRRLIDVIDLPTIPDGESRREIDAWQLMCWALHHKVEEAVVENVQPMPSQEDEDGERRGMGATSAFRFGAGVYGARAALRCAKLPIIPVVSRVWKKHFNLPGGDKGMSRLLAIKLWPDQAAFFERAKDHQRAEGCLIALWRIEKMGML